MRERVIANLAGQLADFMADHYGSVERRGARWVAGDGGAVFSVTCLTEAEAVALDYAARHLAYPDA